MDAFWSCKLIHKRGLVDGLEVGVYKGAWTCLILDNLPLTHVVGIDPYPGIPDIRSIMESETSQFSSTGRFSHFENLSSISSQDGFDFIHIDGEHSETAIRRDLLFSVSKLNDGGILIVDDFMSRLFPGVTAETILVADELNLKPILITEYKIYLVKEADYLIYYADILEIRKNYTLGESGTYRNGLYGETYTQDGEILGVIAYMQPTLGNRKIRKLLSQKETLGSLLKSVRYFLVPPVFELILALLVKPFKNS